MIYFTADLHFGHESIIELANRPFSTVEEMNETLIENWNRKVRGTDTVYIMGDLICKCQNPEQILSRLRGKKILLRGNHDNGWLENSVLSEYFQQVELMIEQSLNSHMVTMCHYPMLEWRGSRKPLECKRLGYLIHGHIHNRFDEQYMPLFLSPNALNAGVDINHYEPVTFEELYQNNSIFKHHKLCNTYADTILTQNESIIIQKIC